MTTMPYPKHVDLSLRLLPFVLVAVFAVFVNKLESWMFPVIKNWSLQSVERHGDTYTLSGTLNKVRACELVATNVMAVPKAALAPRVLLYRIKPEELDGGNAPTGFTQWGPWVMQIPKPFLKHRNEIAFIDVIGTHRCHAFWTQETLYGRIPVDRLP